MEGSWNGPYLVIKRVLYIIGTGEEEFRETHYSPY